MKFLNDNNLYPCDDVKELIIEDNFHYFDKLTKFFYFVFFVNHF